LFLHLLLPDVVILNEINGEGGETENSQTFLYVHYGTVVEILWGAVAVLGKNIWGAWLLIIWEATTAKRNLL